MPLFGDTVAREFYDDMRTQRDQAQSALFIAHARQAELMTELLALKRHDLGLPPMGFNPVDPTSKLGPKTLAAIEEMSQGFPDLRTHLTNVAIVATQTALADQESESDADHMVAEHICAGDEG